MATQTTERSGPPKQVSELLETGNVDTVYRDLYLQRARGFAIGESGLLLLPITLSIAVASTTTGTLISATRRLTLFPVGLAVLMRMAWLVSTLAS